MKKLLALLLAAFLTATIVACKDSDSTTSNKQTTTTIKPSLVETTSTTTTTETTATTTSSTTHSSVTEAATTTQTRTEITSNATSSTTRSAVTKASTTYTKKPTSAFSSVTTTTTTKPAPENPTWEGVSVNKNTLKIVSDTNVTKTITINTDHMEPEYDNETGWARIEDLRRAIYGYGDWILCCEWYTYVNGSGYNASAGTCQDAFIIRTDGTCQKIIQLEKDNGGGYRNQYVRDVAGVSDGWLYFFTFEGERAMGIDEKCNLFKLKISNNIDNMIVQGTFVKEIETIDLWCYCDGKTYINNGWIYYEQNYEAYTDDPSPRYYKVKCDGSEEQEIV